MRVGEVVPRQPLAPRFAEFFPRDRRFPDPVSSGDLTDRTLRSIHEDGLGKQTVVSQTTGLGHKLRLDPTMLETIKLGQVPEAFERILRNDTLAAEFVGSASHFTEFPETVRLHDAQRRGKTQGGWARAFSMETKEFTTAPAKVLAKVLKLDSDIEPASFPEAKPAYDLLREILKADLNVKQIVNQSDFSEIPNLRFSLLYLVTEIVRGGLYGNKEAEDLHELFSTDTPKREEQGHDLRKLLLGIKNMQIK